MKKLEGAPSILEEAANAGLGFVLVFLCWGATTSLYLASYGFTNDLGTGGYLAISLLMFSLIGAVMGAAIGAGMSMFGRLVGGGLKGSDVQRFYYALLAVSIFYWMHFTFQIRDYLKYGLRSESLNLWLLGVLGAYLVLALVVHQVLARRTPSPRGLRIGWAVGALAAGLSIFGHLQIRDTGPGAGNNVFIISVDTLRADRLPAFADVSVQTPAIDGLARDGIVFNRAFSTAPYTWPSLSSILTGKFTINHGTRVNGWPLADEQVTLAELLSENGYETASMAGVDELWMGLGQGFDVSLRQKRGIFEIQPFRRIPLGLQSFAYWFRKSSSFPFTLKALRWLRRLDRPEKNFLWFHLYGDSPHQPYFSPEPFQSMYVPEGNESDFDGDGELIYAMSRNEAEATADDAEKIQALYDGEITWCDRQIGAFLDLLHKKGLYDSATIVFVSDHGQMFGRRQSWLHSDFIFNETLHVPLIIKPPVDSGYLTGQVVEASVSTTDIFPTVAEIQGIGLPEGGVDGTSLVPFLKTGNHEDYEFWNFAETLLYSSKLMPLGGRGNWRIGYAIMDDDYKSIVVPDLDEFHLYTRADHDEIENLEDMEQIAKMGRQAASRFGLTSAAQLTRTRDQEVEDDTIEKLKALGYILE
jgi:arylsulfatase A-like enzyme